jgi:hypothetical protein
MGGSSTPKRETNAERTARLVAAKKSGSDAKALNLQEQYLARARRRPSLFGGPETGTLGGQSATLGVA